MSTTIAGKEWIAKAIAGESVISFDASNAHLGIGDNAAAFDEAQTDLQAVTNKFRKSMAPGYPQRSGNEITYKIILDSDEANFNWFEWGLFNAETEGVMFSRKVEGLGSKATGVWSLTIKIIIDVVE